MKGLFADTAYWIALTNSFDQYHSTAIKVSSSLGTCRIFTTEAVLTEFLNALADKGPLVRAASVDIGSRHHEKLTGDCDPPKPNSARVWRFTKPGRIRDCGSMLLMRERRLSEALTTDRHFEQEGFIALTPRSIEI